MSTFKIGIDARLFRKKAGGIGLYSRELLKQIFSLDTSNRYFVYLTNQDLVEWPFELPNVTVRPVEIPHYSLAEQTKFGSLLARDNLDLVHFLNFNHPLSYRGKFIATIHDLTLLRFSRGENALKESLKRNALRVVLSHASRQASKIISVSSYTSQDIATTFRVDGSRIATIYNGADHIIPGSVSGDSARVVANYLGTSAPYFLFVSDWRSHKGLTTLLKGFKLFVSQVSIPYHLVLGGSHSEVSVELQALLADPAIKDRIITPGFVPSEVLPALYQHSEALVVPSEAEGFGLPIIEGMKYKTPVISSDATCLPEIAQDAALFFRVRDADSLANQMSFVTSPGFDRQSQIAKGIRQSEKYSWRTCGEQTFHEYLSALQT